MKFMDWFKKHTRQERTDLYLRHAGTGEHIHYEHKSHSTEKVEWVSMETDEKGNPVLIRQPEEATHVFSKRAVFRMAGKPYPNFGLFLRKQEGEWGEDLYGRKVLCTKEKYPCFDSYDYLHESRYFRWFFIREGNTVSQLFVSDDRDRIYVTEDLRNVEGWAWKRMQATGFCQPTKE